MWDWAALGIAIVSAFIGGLSKFLYDNWTGEIAWQREFLTHTRKKVEDQSTAYHRLSNHAQVLSDNLNRYLKIKENLQIMSIVPGESAKCIRFNPCYASMYRESVEIAKISLFNAGKFLRILSDTFLVKGLDYFLPDWWASQSLEDFQYALMETLPFDPFILLKYVNEESEFHTFKAKIDTPECSDLRDLFEIYNFWLFNEDKGVKKLSDYANAYDNLFDKQLDLFNKDWYNHAHGWRQKIRLKKTVQPYDYDEFRGGETDFAKLRPETDELIKIFEKGRLKTLKEVEELRLIELSDDIQYGSVNSLITTGWRHYCKEEYELAILAYKRGLDILNKWYKENLKKRKNIYARKMSILSNNLGNVYSNQGIIHKNNDDYKKAEDIFELADAEYRKSIKCYNPDCDSEENCEYNHDIYYVNYAILCLNRAQNYAMMDASGDTQKSVEALGYYDKSINLLKKAVEFKGGLLDLRNISNKFTDVSYYFHLMGYVLCFKIDLLQNKDKEELENLLLKRDDETLENILDEAVRNYMLAISLNPMEHIFYINLANLYYKQGKEKLGIYYQCKGIKLAWGYVNKNVEKEYRKDIESIFDEIKDSDDKYFQECKLAHEKFNNECQIDDGT